MLMYNQFLINNEYVERTHRMFLSAADGGSAGCVIECGPRDFLVHKSVLTDHSEVFRAMFAHKDTVESVQSRIRIADCTATAVHQMLTYLYSGSLPGNFHSDQAAELIEIAEKYALDSLKTICQDKLIDCLSVSNVCAMLKVADTYNADKLMSACIPLVKNNTNQLLDSADWVEIKSANPGLAFAVLEKIVKIPARQ